MANTHRVSQAGITVVNEPEYLVDVSQAGVTVVNEPVDSEKKVQVSQAGVTVVVLSSGGVYSHATAYGNGGEADVTPTRGDRSAWKVSDHPGLHADDIDDGTPIYHVPVPGVAGSVPVSNGSVWVTGFPTAEAALLFSQTVDVTIVNTTTETTLVGAGAGTASVPAGVLVAGSVIRVKGFGYLSDTGTPTLNVRFKLGAVEVCSTGAVTLLSGISSLGFTFEVLIVCRTTGALGSVVASGLFEYDDDTRHRAENVGLSVENTTAALAVDVTAEWGAAAVGNTITCQGLTVELLRADNL